MDIYFDNAATSPLAKEVRDVMVELMDSSFGNPSSIHKKGREAKVVIENARKAIANLLNVSPGEVFFTSGGTEADNMAIVCSVNDLGIDHIITSRIEHHAVLHTAERMEQQRDVKLSFVDLKPDGQVDLDHLKSLLEEDGKTLVSLMHGNNEIGNLLPIAEVGAMCKEHGALFHSDTVQTMGHYPFDLQEITVDFITCSAHKIHGPKGVGFLYIRNDVSIKPFICGGAQERNMRGGTENIFGISALAKAFKLAHEDMEVHRTHIEGLKSYMIESLKNNISGVEFNGNIETDNSLYTVLSVLFPKSSTSEMMLFNLDIAGIAASGGSACTSGSNQGSHVLKGIGTDQERPAVRFSFSRFNTKEEIDFCVAKLTELIGANNN
ncbi:MAG: cysteine desulfurase [Flavobacteriales bacterium]|nr:cysteine desulfurase [Flavobacteriales bacterium]